VEKRVELLKKKKEALETNFKASPTPTYQHMLFKRRVCAHALKAARMSTLKEARATPTYEAFSY
jgi:hypothetical protein